MRTEQRRRRQILASLAVGVVGLAGCTGQGTTNGKPSTGGDTSTDEETTSDGETSTERTDTATPTDDGETTDPDSETTDAITPASTADATGTLDRREANVVAVECESVDGGVRFDVSLNHDDSGEEGYANWWQVERLDGTQLGRRELLHAHTDQPFTRSETIEIPDDVSCVVVRGHDQTHGYGGVAMLISLDSEEMQSIDQGSEPRSFDASECPCVRKTP